MKTKHTQGEWIVNIAKPLLPGMKKQIHILTDFGTSTQTICQISERKEWEVNAKLIASAPDLLNCLLAMTDYIQFMDSNQNVIIKIPLKLSEKIGEAIKKATE